MAFLIQNWGMLVILALPWPCLHFENGNTLFWYLSICQSITNFFQVHGWTPSLPVENPSDDLIGNRFDSSYLPVSCEEEVYLACTYLFFLTTFNFVQGTNLLGILL